MVDERAILATDINSGPLSTELSTMVSSGDDVGVAKALNQKDIPTGKQVEAWRAKKLLITQGKWRELLAACATSTNACLIVDLADDPNILVDFTETAVSDALTALEVAGLLVAADIKALSADFTSRADVLLGHDVTHLDVAHALRAQRGW